MTATAPILSRYYPEPRFNLLEVLIVVEDGNHLQYGPALL